MHASRPACRQARTCVARCICAAEHTDASSHATLVPVLLSQAYNYTAPAALQLDDPRQWRKALEAGPRSNAKSSKRPKARAAQRTSPRPKTQADSAASASMAGTKRVRATMYRIDPNDPDLPWPPSRHTGYHRLAEHTDGGKHLCDYPGCSVDNKAGSKALKTPAAAGRGGKGGRGRGRGHASFMSPPSGRGRGSGSSLPPGLTARPQIPSTAARPARDSSPAGSASSDGSQAGRSRTKLFCMDCYDPSNTRPMNFHPECWTKWHCPQCADD